MARAISSLPAPLSPAISAGIYGYPLPGAATVGLLAVRDHLVGETTIQRATFVLYSRDTFEAFAAALAALESPS